MSLEDRGRLSAIGDPWQLIVALEEGRYRPAECIVFAQPLICLLIAPGLLGCERVHLFRRAARLFDTSVMALRDDFRVARHQQALAAVQAEDLKQAAEVERLEQWFRL